MLLVLRGTPAAGNEELDPVVRGIRCSLAQGAAESWIEVGYTRSLVIEDRRAVGDGTVSLARRTTVVTDGAERRNLWAASLVSAFVWSDTRLVLPLTAELALGAGPVEIGLLAAASTLPSFLFGRSAGVVVDRLPRRQLLVVKDVDR